MSAIPVRVALRIRPLSSKEIDNGCDTAIDKVTGRSQVTIRNSEKAFTYDYAFSTDSQQSDVYDSVKPLINQLFQGYNATVLAYGQTGSGKTFSMGTSNREGEIESALEGVIPRAVKEIFSKIGELQDDYDFCVRVAFIELYKEKLYDLLSIKSKIKEDCIVDLREDPTRGVVIANLTEVVVGNLRQTMEQLENGSVKRVTAATAMNNTSSRSHAIFTIYVEGTRKSTVVEPVEAGQDKLDNIVSKFHLVDLAGSERAKKTMATGIRYKEGVSINLGLLALGNVISALGDDSGPKTHIPYRDSKLTRLLQDSLGGNSHTLMIACVSPADTNVEETVSTLRYADRARKIKNKPVVNQDGKDAENAKLRREIAELRVQVMNGGGGGGSGSGPLGSNTLVSSREVTEYKSKISQLTSENRELTSALMSCQDELSHLNEKVILSEDSNIKLKTKLEELVAETERLAKASPLNPDFDSLLRKIRDVETYQKHSEKSLADHDTTRFDTANSSATSDLGFDTAIEVGAAEALKQNALATQLAALNKQLAQKEQIAISLTQQEDKLKEVRHEYEAQLDQMESQLTTLGKEKEQLHQHNKAEPANSKLSEQRRKRIQELEGEMSNLRKKVIEQQRMIKLNEKNEQKLKTLGAEIYNMKQAKVRLIRQMKEEAEKVRSWKIQKEKEVNKLKQAERKQQVQITKMTNLNTKQQNVLRRKMEEACAANKRLKDVIDKQKAAKKMASLGKQGLAGAAERMRNLVSQELDVVVSVKEAKKSREQLLKDRTLLSKQLTDLRRKQRVTMTNTEREEMMTKIKDLEDELAMQNVQISELQKQIMDADAQENDNQGSSVNNKWWDTLATMTEAKIALQYLFEKAADGSASYSNTLSMYNELKVIHDEAMKNTEALEEEIANLKDEHEDQMMESGKDYEERVAFLLKQLTSKSGLNGGDDSIKEADIQKFSKLQEALMKMTQDFETNQKAKAKNLLTSGKKTRNGQRYGENEFFESQFDTSDDDDNDSDNEIFDDPDWHQTPLIKRIKKIRDTNNQTMANNKRKLGETFSEAENEAADGAPKAKRSSVLGVCGCKNGCKTKRCSCVKSGKGCSDTCKCPLAQCGNRGDRAGSGGNFSSNDNTVLSDMSNNTTAGTMSLLNDTYQIPDVNIESPTKMRKITPAITNENMSSPSAPRKQAPSLFKSPFSRTSGSSSPSNTMQSQVPRSSSSAQLFKSPVRD